MTKEYLIQARVTPVQQDNHIYRIYLDDDLITERTFTWGKNCCVEEKIFAELSEGKHYLKIESFNTDSSIEKKVYSIINRIFVDGILTPININNGLFSI